MASKLFRNFEFKKFGARFESVPVAFWDDDANLDVPQPARKSGFTTEQMGDLIGTLTSAGLIKPGQGLREVTGPLDQRKRFVVSRLAHDFDPVKHEVEPVQAPPGRPRLKGVLALGSTLAVAETPRVIRKKGA